MDFQGSFISLVQCISWKQRPQMEAQFCSHILVTLDNVSTLLKWVTCKNTTILMLSEVACKFKIPQLVLVKLIKHYYPLILADLNLSCAIGKSSFAGGSLDQPVWRKGGRGTWGPPSSWHWSCDSALWSSRSCSIWFIIYSLAALQKTWRSVLWI